MELLFFIFLFTHSLFAQSEQFLDKVKGKDASGLSATHKYVNYTFSPDGKTLRLNSGPYMSFSFLDMYNEVAVYQNDYWNDGEIFVAFKFKNSDFFVVSNQKDIGNLDPDKFDSAESVSREDGVSFTLR